MTKSRPWSNPPPLALFPSTSRCVCLGKQGPPPPLPNLPHLWRFFFPQSWPNPFFIRCVYGNSSFIPFYFPYARRRPGLWFSPWTWRPFFPPYTGQTEPTHFFLCHWSFRRLNFSRPQDILFRTVLLFPDSGFELVCLFSAVLASDRF